MERAREFGMKYTKREIKFALQARGCRLLDKLFHKQANRHDIVFRESYSTP